MAEIDINEIPVLEFDPGIPDTQWGDPTTAAVTSIVQDVIIIIF